MKQSIAVLALFLGLNQAVDRQFNERVAYSPVSFAEAAADARQRSGADQAAWQENFIRSKFYKEYARHNQEVQILAEESAQNKEELRDLKMSYARLQQKYEELRARENQLTLAENKFAEGYSEKEGLGETITVNGNEHQEKVRFVQAGS